MLKGVSQKVIEVVHTDNRYFEKAILFLRPGAQEQDQSFLKSQAGDYLSKIDYHPPARGGFKLFFTRFAGFLFSALFGAGVACFFFTWS